MEFSPLIDFRATTIFRAFLLNAVLLGLVAGLSIELRFYIDYREETKHLSRLRKMLITVVGTIVIAIAVYVLARFCVGFGGGLLAAPDGYPTFF